MSRRWAIIVIISVVTVVLWSGAEAYKAFKKEKDVGEYKAYVTSISQELDTDLIKKVTELQMKVLVKDEDIQPQAE